MKFQNTKALRSAYEQYKRTYSDGSLFELYDKPSKAKWDALDYCKSLMRELKGSGLKILGGNIFAFSVGFTFPDENGNKCFAYITRDNNRYMKIG